MITPIMRPSFVNIIEPRDFDDGKKPKYTMAIAIPKTEKTFLKELDAEVERVAKDKWTKIPVKMQSVIRNGDEENEDGERPEFANCVIFNCSSTRKPGIVVKKDDADDRQAELPPLPKLEDYLFATGKDVEQVIYSGMECRASINVFAYEFQGRKGISVGLNNVMKTGDNEPYAGGATAESDFSDYV